MTTSVNAVWLYILTNSAAYGVIIARVDQNVQSKAAVNEVVVDRSGGHGRAVGAVVLDAVAARSPLNRGLHVQRDFHRSVVEVSVRVVVRTWLVFVCYCQALNAN